MAEILSSGRNQKTEIPFFEKRILVLAPLENDGSLTVKFLTSHGMDAVACSSMAEFERLFNLGCGALIIAEEALTSQNLEGFKVLLAEQPSWSYIPITIIAGRGIKNQGKQRSWEALGPAGNVIILERPFPPATLMGMMEMSLHSRQRQYQVRQLLEETRAQKQQLEFVLHAGRLGAWSLDLTNTTLVASATWKEIHGFKQDDNPRYHQLLDMVEPESQKAWEEALRKCRVHGDDFGLEYKITTSLNEERWIHASGKLEAAREGGPVLHGITQDITPRKLSEVALQQQATALKEADRRKDEFLAMLAHELRNPLSSVSNSVAVLKADEDDESRTWAVDVIERQNAQLGRLVDDLLDVSRITRGKIRLRKELIDAAVCIADAIETVKPLMDARKHTFEADVPVDQLWLEADATRLEQIVVNLLANAAKYTPQSGRIKLEARVEPQDHFIVISITDNGMGIAPDRISEMFELFAQGERSIARSEGGLGIGLTVVRGLCELHGGTVTARSRGAGKGSTFTVTLPGKPKDERKSEMETAGKAYVQQGGGQKILVVDDNVDTAQGLKRLLSKRGYDVSLAYNGHDALRVTSEVNPAVILLDIGLPELDGYQIARLLRQRPECQETLIVALSGYGQEEDMRLSSEAGFDHHFVKPVPISELCEFLRAGLE